MTDKRQHGRREGHRGGEERWRGRERVRGWKVGAFTDAYAFGTHSKFSLTHAHTHTHTHSPTLLWSIIIIRAILAT